MCQVPDTTHENATYVSWLTELEGDYCDPWFNGAPSTMSPTIGESQMKKLRNALAAALLIVPVLSVDANALVASPTTVEVKSQRNLTPTCYTYVNGRWIGYPC